MKQRLDDLLVSRGLAGSKTQAKALVMAGRVHSGTERMDKPGRTVDAGVPLSVAQPPRFVSRGGEKLAAALERFPVPVAGAHVLDIGASTGGFTDCCLQAGAASVTCVDVGRAQLHSRLRSDPRVTNIEKLNARTMSAADLPRPTFGVVVIDVSFISLRAVLEPAWRVLGPGGVLVALVKPQFEAGKAEADRGRGVIRDPGVRQSVLRDVTGFAMERLEGAQLLGTLDSPIEGADGNREFLLCLARAAGIVGGRPQP